METELVLVNKIMLNLNANINDIKKQSDMVLENAYKGGRIVGKFHALVPINKIISGDPLPRTEALLAIFSVMIYVREWFNSNFKLDSVKQCDLIIKSVTEDLRNVYP